MKVFIYKTIARFHHFGQTKDKEPMLSTRVTDIQSLENHPSPKKQKCEQVVHSAKHKIYIPKTTRKPVVSVAGKYGIPQTPQNPTECKKAMERELLIWRGVDLKKVLLVYIMLNEYSKSILKK